ncbi:hypothetical protein [Methylobacterium persicinum]|uniref:Histidine kinase n=1 Tax=Methylobacterium persicinum TaxID=374426 RepID=A0ABU0HP99_9HYPH|nr:hypothetical protein [Methylobacterium persicinum]MDQ0444159.1 hypothetical protein [Methylobacterium persicinum]
MAHVHRLPVRLEGEAGRRLTDDLVAVLQAGGDPGPRQHQIEVLRQSIRVGLRGLTGALASIADPLPIDDPRRRAVEEAVRRFVDEVEALVVMVDRTDSVDRVPRAAAGPH